MRLFTSRPVRKPAKPYIPFLLGCIAFLLLAAAMFTFAGTIFKGGADEDTRNAIAAAEYTELSLALDAFDTIGYPNADVEGDVLPRLKLHLHAANVLDALLINEYGAKYSMIDAEVYRYITLTLEEIDAAFAQNTSPDAGIENLRVYMLLLQNQLSGRINEQGQLLPAG